jgi:hypothetical protein
MVPLDSHDLKRVCQKMTLGRFSWTSLITHLFDKRRKKTLSHLNKESLCPSELCLHIICCILVLEQFANLNKTESMPKDCKC